MKEFSKIVFGIILAIFMVSCLTPSSKESYLEKFERFVDRVEQNHEKYTEKDWEWAEEQFQKYSSDWYLKFKSEYTFHDQIKIKGFIIRYHSYKTRQDVGEVLNQLFKEDVDDVRKKVKEYIDNDMDEDLDKLLDGAAAIGDSAVKVLEDIIKELDESF